MAHGRKTAFPKNSIISEAAMFIWRRMTEEEYECGYFRVDAITCNIYQLRRLFGPEMPPLDVKTDAEWHMMCLTGPGAWSPLRIWNYKNGPAWNAFSGHAGPGLDRIFEWSVNFEDGRVFDVINRVLKASARQT
tara:strand:- start:288 stop:689 length:402 start_codon:yes stop_codon:yes gene_type:complete